MNTLRDCGFYGFQKEKIQYNENNIEFRFPAFFKDMPITKNVDLTKPLHVKEEK